MKKSLLSGIAVFLRTKIIASNEMSDVNAWIAPQAYALMLMVFILRYLKRRSI